MELTPLETPLTDTRHEAFARLMAEGKLSQGEAYLTAGYHCSSPAIASAAANRLLKNVKVQTRISYLQEQAAQAVTLDQAYVLNGLMRNAQAGYEERDLSASNRALELLGKYLKLWDEAPAVQIANVTLSDERRAAVVASLLRLEPGAESSG